jgi:hypothetical protein
MTFTGTPQRARFLAALTLGVLALSCEQRKSSAPAAADSSGATRDPTAKSASAPVATSVTVANPDAPTQLVEGFYAVEDNAWRWTAKRFIVKLGTPPNAQSAGATLRFKFALPDVALKKYEKLAISASIGNVSVAPQSFSSPGRNEYLATIPASALRDGSVQITFMLDKSMPPSGADQRELGVIAHQFSLEPK